MKAMVVFTVGAALAVVAEADDVVPWGWLVLVLYHFHRKSIVNT